jgi:glycosyltransferase involved in cell wall biosynthesis
VVIVVPCFNEEQRLDVEQFRAFRSDDDVHFLFVNDGSTDGTLPLLEKLAASEPERFSVLDLEQNAGKAEAVRRGVLAAIAMQPEAVAFWDADLATPLAAINRFLEVMHQRPEIAMVFGARIRLLGRDISRRPARHYVGRIGATLISSSLGLPIYDTQCGAKLFRVSDELREVFSRPFLSRWIFDVEVIARFVQRCGRKRMVSSIYELPLSSWHDVEGSKVRSRDFVHALTDLWRIHRAYRGKSPNVKDT